MKFKPLDISKIDWFAAMNPKPIKVSWKGPPINQFAKCIGTKLGTDGKVRPRIFWLGKDMVTAQHKTQCLMVAWASREYFGAEHWTDALEKSAQWHFEQQQVMADAVISRHRNDIASLRRSCIPVQGAYTMPFAGPTPHAQPSAAPATAVTSAMLHATIAEYQKTVRTRSGSGDYRRRVCETIEDLKHYIADAKAIAVLTSTPTKLRSYLKEPKASVRWQQDVPLQQIDRLWLERLTNHVKSRPLSRRPITEKNPERKRIKPFTVTTLMQHWRQFFNWLDINSETFGWDAPKRMDQLFNVDMHAIRDKQERDAAADGPEQLTLDEIKALLVNGNDRQRMFVLMGLFTAQGQKELAVTRRDEFDLARPSFAHRRNKTRQLGRYWLPPELVLLLKDYFHDVEPIGDNLAFTTARGLPLVRDNSDSVQLMFYKLREKAGITRPGVSFYSCRRFLGDQAKRAGGSDMLQAALSQAANTVGQRHYSNVRDYDAIFQLGQNVYQQMKAAGCFDWAAGPARAAA